MALYPEEFLWSISELEGHGLLSTSMSLGMEAGIRRYSTAWWAKCSRCLKRGDLSSL